MGVNTQHLCKGWVWTYTSIIPVLGRQTGGNPWGLLDGNNQITKLQILQ